MLDLEVCAFYWKLGLDRLDELGLDGARATAQFREAQDALRAARLEHLEAQAMSADGHVSRTSADLATESVAGGFVSTAVMADRLHVGVRHARRLASEAGIEPAARDAWHSTDVDRLEASRRSA